MYADGFCVARYKVILPIAFNVAGLAQGQTYVPIVSILKNSGCVMTAPYCI